MARRRAGAPEAPSNVISVQRITPDTADVSATWRALGDTAREIQGRMQPEMNRLADAAARRDFKAGRVAQRRVWVAEDEAYNNAMAQSYLLQAESDVEVRARDLESEFGLDVEGFDRAFEAARGEFLANAPADFAPHMGTVLDRAHVSSRARIGERRRTVAAQAFQQNAAARLAHVEANLSGFTDLTSPEFAETWEQYQSIGDALVENPLSGVHADEWTFRRDNTLSRLRAQVFQETFIAAYEEGGANAQAAAAAIEGARAAIFDPSLTLTEAQREEAFADVRSVVGQAEAARRQRDHELRVEMNQLRGIANEEARELGTGIRARLGVFAVVDDATMDEYRRAVEASGNPARVRELNAAVIENNTRRLLHGRSLVEIGQFNQEMAARVAQGDEGSADAAVRLDFGRRYAQHMRRGNPLDTIQLHADLVPPPVIGSNGVNPRGLGQRTRFAEMAAREVGAAVPQYFREEEREYLAGLARAGGEEALALAREIAAAAFSEEGGFQRAQSMFAEIAGRGGEALQAAGVTLLLGGEASAPAARYIMEAQRLRGVEGYKPPDVPGVNDNTWRQRAFVAVLGSDRAGAAADDQAQIRLAADLIFEARVAESPSLMRNYNAAYQEAVRMALGEVRRDLGRGERAFGGVARVGDARVAIPNWIRTDQFANLRAALTLDDYRDASAGLIQQAPPGLSLSELRRARLAPAGAPGQYYLLDDDDAAIAAGPGEPYVLDLNRLRDQLADRRPDAVVR